MSGLRGTSSIAIIAAMVPELQPTIRKLRLEPLADGDHVHHGMTGDRRVVAAVSSIGTQAATDTTSRVLDNGPVDHVIVIGICGGIDPALPIGALVVPTETMVEVTGRTCRPVALDHHRPAGRLLTTDHLHTDAAVVAALHDEGYIAVDMETGAIGAVCEDRGVPWSVFRSVSDRAGDPAVDTELMEMSTADGTPDAAAVARYVARHPGRLPKLTALGLGMRMAVATSTHALLAALEA